MGYMHRRGHVAFQFYLHRQSMVPALLLDDIEGQPHQLVSSSPFRLPLRNHPIELVNCFELQLLQ